MLSNLPNSLGLILETLKNQATYMNDANPVQGLNLFPLGAQRGNFQIGGAMPQSQAPGGATGAATQQN